MFPPLVTAEFPIYYEAFAYTQANAIENGIGLMKKRTTVGKRATLSATGPVLRPRILSGESCCVPAGQGK